MARRVLPCRCGGYGECRRCGATSLHPVVSLNTLCQHVIGVSQSDYGFNEEDLYEAFDFHGWGHLFDEWEAAEEAFDREEGEPSRHPAVVTLLEKLREESSRGEA